MSLVIRPWDFTPFSIFSLIKCTFCLGILSGTDNRGMNYFDKDRMTNLISNLQGCFDFHIHAIGDRGVREALDAIEVSGGIGPAHRHRLTHIEMVDEADVGRFASLGVFADAQVCIKVIA